MRVCKSEEEEEEEEVQPVKRYMDMPKCELKKKLLIIGDSLSQRVNAMQVRGAREIAQDAHDIVNIRIRQLAAATWFMRYELACYLHRIFVDNLWQRPDFSLRGEKYTSYANWVYLELGINARTARYLRSIAKTLYDLDFSGDTVKHLFVGGWFRAYQILRVAKTEIEVQQWLETTKAKNQEEVRGMVRLAQSSEVDVVEQESSKKVVTKELQDAIDCNIKFKDAADYTFFTKASGLVHNRYGAKSPGEVVGMLAAHYLSTSLQGSGEELPVEIEIALQAIEKAYKVKVQVVNASS